jgi:iron complex outermembrane recepter protein
MNSNPKLSLAIAAILSGSGMGVGIAHAADAADVADADSEGIPEIQVTAQRRTESIQDVPITIQAITGTQLKSLNVETFDDLLKYTPNVTYSGNTPGGGNIFMRGLSQGGAPGQSQSTTAPFPNVGLYLDDQSMQYPARNVDVYLVDMERVEILEGPQGTLFGGGAQAGAVRYITNKPKVNVTEGDVNASYGLTAGGDPNSSLNAMINLPLIPDALAVRAVIFEDHRGGYIDNVPGTISFGNSPVVNNSALVQNNQNPVTYDGVRLEALYQINEDWSALITQNYQNMRADGYYADYPTSTTVGGNYTSPTNLAIVGATSRPLAPYQIDAFTPAFNNDRYESTSWTLNGKFPTFGNFGDIKAVYTGSYLSRHIEAQSDYSSYLVSTAGSYYTCTGKGAAYFKSAKATTCYAPVGDWNDKVHNTHQTHEIRLTTSDENRVRGTLGGFWEDFKIYDEMNFNYLPIPQCNPANLASATAPVGAGPDCVTAVGPIPGNFANDPNLRVNSNTAFGEDDTRGYRQAAVFTSVDFDIIPKVLTLTGGTRYFHYDEFERGSEYFTETSPGVINVPNGVCTAGAGTGCGFGINLNKQEHGFKSRGNLTWHITPDMMLYYTYSQGFRPGGFNRTESAAGGVPVLKGEAPFTTAKTTDQYLKPDGYNSDSLINNEIGFKSEFLEHRLQVNASAYRMQWSNVQFLIFDPPHLGNTQFVTNGPSYSITGFELQAVARVTEGLTLQGSGSWNSSSERNAPCLQSNDPIPGNPTPIGTCITTIKNGSYVSPYGALGSATPFSPSMQFTVRARYDFHFGDYKPWVSAGANHIGTMSNEPSSYYDGNVTAATATAAAPNENPPTTTVARYSMPGYTTYDASVGVAKDNWTVQFTGNNLSNNDASTFTSSGGFIKSEVPLRPRVLTFGFGYKF